MKEYLFSVLVTISLFGIGFSWAATEIDTSGVKLYFDERLAGEKRLFLEVETQYIRSYVASLQYTGNKIISSIDGNKAIKTESELKSISAQPSYAYKIFGVFKDSLGNEAHYQNSSQTPLSISDSGDLYFTSYAGDLDYEYLDANNGIYPITINAYKRVDLPNIVADETKVSSLHRSYVASFSYSSSSDEGLKISSSFHENKKYSTVETLKNEAVLAPFYEINGIYLDSDGKEQTYAGGTTPPLAINASGDLYFTAAGGILGKESMAMNKGEYKFSVVAKDANKDEILGSRTDFILEIKSAGDESTIRLLTPIKGSGSVFTVYLRDNLNEFALRPQHFPTTLEKEPGTLTGKISVARLFLPSRLGVVANFSAQFANEEGVVPSGVSYDVTYSIKGSPTESSLFPVSTSTSPPTDTTTPTPSVIPTIIPTPIPQPCETDNDAQFFYIGEKTGIISFVPDNLLSEPCRILKSQKTKFVLDEVSFSAQKKVVLTNLRFANAGVILSDASASFDPATALDSFSEVYRLEITITSVPTSAPTLVPTSVPTSAPVSGGGGGGSSAGGWAYVATATPTPCEKIVYKRYPEKRGKGVSSTLFSDASSSHRAYKSLIDLGEQGVVNGDQATGKARLDDPIARSEFVKIVTVGRQDTLETDLCLKTSLFPDVLPSDWFSRFVWNMESRDFVNGYEDGYYRPGKNINLAESYKIIALSFGYISPNDARIAIKTTGVEWFVPYKKALEDAHVIPSWMQTYNMATVISRGDMFALLSNVLKDKDGVL